MRRRRSARPGTASASAPSAISLSFSFQANKNVTSSEGGCLVLNNAEEARLAEKYRLQGVTRSGFDGIDVDVLGGKYNMTDVAAAIGLGQFAHIDAITARRKQLARHYFTTFGRRLRARQRRPTAGRRHGKLQLAPVPARAAGNHARAPHSWSRCSNKTSASAITTRRSTCSALYRARGFKEGMFPVAERVGRQIVSLPMFNSIGEEDIERVVGAVKSVLCQ